MTTHCSTTWKFLVLLIAATTATLTAPRPVHATNIVPTFTVTFTQENGNVIARGSGTLNLSAFLYNSTFPASPGIDPGYAFIDPGGAVPPNASVSIDEYRPLATTLYEFLGTPVGTATTTTNATSSSNYNVGFDGFGYLLIDHALTSGSTTATTINVGVSTPTYSEWDNQTFSSLGLNPGSHTVMWFEQTQNNVGGWDVTPVDEYVVDVCQSPVPEPPTLVLLAISSLCLLALVIVRRYTVRV